MCVSFKTYFHNKLILRLEYVENSRKLHNQESSYGVKISQRNIRQNNEGKHQKKMAPVARSNPQITE